MARSTSDFALLGRLFRRAQPYWIHIIGILCLSLLASPLALLTPLPVKIAVDSVIGNQPLPGFLEPLVPSRSETEVLILAVCLLLAITLLGQIQELATSLLRTYTGEKLVLEFRSELFRYVQRLSVSYTDTRGTADTAYRIQYDAPAIQSIAIDGIIPFIAAAVTVGGMIYIAARIDWQLACVALTISPILFATISFYRRRLRRRSREVKKLESSAFSVVQEVLGAIRVVKAFGQEDREQERFVDRSSRGMRARIQLVLAEGGFGLVIGLLTALGTAGVLYIGVRHVQSGILTLGELLLVLGYLAQLYSPLKTMSKKVARLQNHLASAERAISLLEETPDVVECPRARSLVRASGSIAFRGVSFTYDRERPVLSDVSFELPSGTRLGISGTTGAGKTTLVSLLTRFYDPTQGEILLDGVDLRQFKVVDLRNQFAIVLQEPVLFSTSIAENIAYARPRASEEEIIDAARAAGAHEFIFRLPQGYETLVGERGMLLSGGERQRIALARAFLKDAPILILDEPTSAVDVKTENEIMAAMEELMKGRTAILIAHRLRTLAICEERIEIEQGRLVSASEGVTLAATKRSVPSQGGIR